MHVVTTLPDPIALDGAVTVHALPNGRDNLVWLLVDRARGEAAAVDGIEAGLVLERCAALGVRLVAVLNTHTHADHVGINRDLLGRGVTDLRVIGPRKVAADVPGLTEPVGGGDAFEVLSLPVTVLDTEGHQDGHVSYVVPGAVFCGDALFTAGAGRMFDGPPEAYHAGLARLRALPDATRVFCAHEYTEDNLRFARWLAPDDEALADRVERVAALRVRGLPSVPSTLGEERRTNPFLRWDDPTHAALVAARLGSTPVDAVALVAATRGLKDTGAYRR